MLHASEDDTESTGRVNFRKIHCLPFSLKATPSGLQPLNVVILSSQDDVLILVEYGDFFFQPS